MAPSKQVLRPTLDTEHAVKILNTIEQDFNDFQNKMNFTIATFRSLLNNTTTPINTKSEPKSVPLKEAVRLLREYYAEKFGGSTKPDADNNLEDQPHQNLDSVNKELINTVEKVVKRRTNTKTKPKTKPVHDEEWFKKYVGEYATVPECGLVQNEVDKQPLVL